MAVLFGIQVPVCAGGVSTSLDRDAVNRGFQEIAPIITQVSVLQGDPFVEVFVSGYFNDGDCFDKKEYIVENDKTETRIVARFRRSHPDATCKDGKKTFREKAADLDSNNPASKVVYVLGAYGWHRGELDGASSLSSSPANLEKSGSN